MYATEERPMLGGLGFAEPQRVSIQNALDVLADKTQFDPNGKTSSGWVIALSDADFFNDLSFEMKQEIARFVAKNNCVALRRIRQHLVDTLEEIEGEL
jgi:hypothetical protein